MNDDSRSRAKPGARNARAGSQKAKARTKNTQAGTQTAKAGTQNTQAGTQNIQGSTRKATAGTQNTKPAARSAQGGTRNNGDARGKQPWFGSRASGMGYRPRTWQGYLVMAILAAYAIFIGTLSADHHSPLILLAIAPAAIVPRLIGLFQRR